MCSYAISRENLSTNLLCYKAHDLHAQCSIYNINIYVLISKRYAYHRSEAGAWEENNKFKFHISDEIKGNLFLLEEAESRRRMPRDQTKLAESIYAYACA